MISQNLKAQVAVESCFQNSNFTGTPEPNDCSDIPLPCSIVLGNPITHSSQLSSSIITGAICIEGTSFTVNTLDFTFQDATVYIAPDVEIIVEVNSKLILDNATLIGCDGLWDGIRIKDNATIKTLNNTKIQDARAAIKSVNTFNAALEIEETIFDRNLTGIWLEDVPLNFQTIKFTKFRSNRFLCTSPIVGTSAGISDHGIYVKNVPLSLQFDQSSLLTEFRNLKYGIKYEGQYTFLFSRSLLFRDIANACIQMDAGYLDVRNSYFLNFSRYGIWVQEVEQVDVDACTFFIDENQANFQQGQARSAIELSKSYLVPTFKGKARIRNSFFTFSVNSTLNPAFDIQYGIRSTMIGKKDVQIYKNRFNLFGSTIHGINIQCPLYCTPLNENYDIYDNDFLVVNPSTNETPGWCFGITARGEINNCKVIGNRFESYDRDFTFFGVYSRDIGIHFDELDGVGNEITDNTFAPYTSTGMLNSFFVGAWVESTSNVKICSNQDIAHAGRLFYFNGDNMGLSLTQNSMLGGGFDIDGRVFLQEQKDNRFNPFFFSTYVRCLDGNCNTHSRFRQRQNPDSEYFPDIQVCGFDPITEQCSQLDEFYRQLQGQSPLACIEQFVYSPDNEDLLNDIALGNVDPEPGYPAKEWKYNYYLYKLLNLDTTLRQGNAAFTNFLDFHQQSALGKIWEARLLAAAAIDIAGDDYILNAQLDSIEQIRSGLIWVDSLIQAADSSQEIEGLLSDRQVLLFNYYSKVAAVDSLKESYIPIKTAMLQNALALINQVSDTLPWIQNEKTINSILLSAFLSQSNQLSELQRDSIRAIKWQCLKTGGLAVMQAAGIFTGCDEPDPYYSSSCNITPVQQLYLTDSLQERSKGLHIKSNTPGQLEINLYWTPSNEIIIESNQSFIGRFRMLDITGREHMSSEIQVIDQVTIPFYYTLPSGVYILNISGEGIQMTRKIHIR